MASGAVILYAVFGREVVPYAVRNNQARVPQAALGGKVKPGAVHYRKVKPGMLRYRKVKPYAKVSNTTKSNSLFKLTF